MLQRSYPEYYTHISKEIDHLYAFAEKSDDPVAFICVVGSSGMGKSQLAFDLGGKHPWFNWPVIIGSSPQFMYRCFLQFLS